MTTASNEAALSLPCSESSNTYRLEKVSEIEAQLWKELVAHEAVYGKYKRAVNWIDCVGNALSAVTVAVVVGVTLLNKIAAVPAGIALESIAAVSGPVTTAGCVAIHRLNRKEKKHYHKTKDS